MDQSFKRNIVTSLIWSIIGQFGYMVIGLGANIILARLLTPYEFGQVGIVMFFIIIAKVLTESGLSGALIRKKNASEEDFSTVFIFNLAISFILMFLLILSSSLIANFYNDKELKNILIASSSVLLINAFQITQTAKLVKELKYKQKGLYEFFAILIAAIIGVILAFNEYGVWSIVAMQIITAFMLTVFLWIFEGPLKKIEFSNKSFKALYKFGVNTTLASLLNTAFDNIYQLVLGKYFAISQTGLFFQAKKLQEVPVGLIKSTTLGVVFSSLSRLQDDLIQFNLLYKRIVTFFTIAVGLICLLIFYYAENIILLLYGAKWLEASFYMQILILASFFYIQEIFNRVIFKVFDRTEKILYLEIIKKTIQTLSILVGVVLLNIEILLYGFLITSILSYFINFHYSRKVQGDFTWYEIVLVLITIAISIVTVLIGILLKEYLQLEGYYSFWLLPILLFAYFTGIQIFIRNFNLLKDTKMLIKLIVRKK